VFFLFLERLIEPLTLKAPFKTLISIANNLEKLHIFARWQSKCDNLYHAHDHFISAKITKCFPRTEFRGNGEQHSDTWNAI